VTNITPVTTYEKQTSLVKTGYTHGPIKTYGRRSYGGYKKHGY
jgi:hypothetical protein